MMLMKPRWPQRWGESDMADKHSGLMRVLMVMNYKSCPVYVRMVCKSTFIWDAIVNNQLFSSYIVMMPGKGRNKLTVAEINEVTKMCYAGAAATVDTILGVKLSDTDQDMLKKFELATKNVETTNAKPN